MLPIGLFERWQRQINTDYKDLSEDEKESDRKEVRSYDNLITQDRTQLIEEVIEKLDDEISAFGGLNKGDSGYYVAEGVIMALKYQRLHWQETLSKLKEQRELINKQN